MEKLLRIFVDVKKGTKGEFNTFRYHKVGTEKTYDVKMYGDGKPQKLLSKGYYMLSTDTNNMKIDGTDKYGNTILKVFHINSGDFNFDQQGYDEYIASKKQELEDL